MCPYIFSICVTHTLVSSIFETAIWQPLFEDLAKNLVGTTHYFKSRFCMPRLDHLKSISLPKITIQSKTEILHPEICCFMFNTVVFDVGKKL